MVSAAIVLSPCPAAATVPNTTATKTTAQNARGSPYTATTRPGPR